MTSSPQKCRAPRLCLLLGWWILLSLHQRGTSAGGNSTLKGTPSPPVATALCFGQPPPLALSRAVKALGTRKVLGDREWTRSLEGPPAASPEMPSTPQETEEKGGGSHFPLPQLLFGAPRRSNATNLLAPRSSIPGPSRCMRMAAPGAGLKSRDTVPCHWAHLHNLTPQDRRGLVTKEKQKDK